MVLPAIGPLAVGAGSLLAAASSAVPKRYKLPLGIVGAAAVFYALKRGVDLVGDVGETAADLFAAAKGAVLGEEEGPVGAPKNKPQAAGVDGGLSSGGATTKGLVARIIEPTQAGQVVASIAGTYEVVVEVENKTNQPRSATVELLLTEQTVGLDEFAGAAFNTFSLPGLLGWDVFEAQPDDMKQSVLVNVPVPPNSATEQRVAVDLLGGFTVLKARVLASVHVSQGPPAKPQWSSSTWFNVVRV